MGPHCVGPPQAPPDPRHAGLLYRTPSPDMGPYYTAPTNIDIGGQDWRSVQTCSLEGPSSTDICWLLRHVRLASGRYASYWNAFLSNMGDKKKRAH